MDDSPSQNMVPTPQAAMLMPSPDLRDEVLRNPDILSKIMAGVDSPTTVVRAAAVDKFWRKIASSEDFLRRFRDDHPSLLLGFYLAANDYPSLSFAKMPDLPEELAADVRRGRFASTPAHCEMVTIYDCRNGFVIIGGFGGVDAIRRLVPPNGAPAVALVWPHGQRPGTIHSDVDGSVVVLGSSILLPEDGRGYDGQSCTSVALVRAHGDGRHAARAHVREFRAGTWNKLRASNKIFLPRGQIDVRRNKNNFCLLAHGKAYMLGALRQIAALDLATMNLFKIQLPQGVECNTREQNLCLSKAEGSGFNLVHVSGVQLHVWLHGGFAADDWTLVDAVDLRLAFGTLADPAWLSGAAVCNVLAVGENASFVFFQVIAEVFYLHVSSRQVKRVFDLPPWVSHMCPFCRYVIKLDPVTIVWPPTFNELKTSTTGGYGGWLTVSNENLRSSCMVDNQGTSHECLLIRQHCCCRGRLSAYEINET